MSTPCTTFGKRSLKYKGSHMWNSLPESLKSIQSTSLFKNSLSVFLLTAVWSGHWMAYIYALCTLHLAPCTTLVIIVIIISFYNVSPAKMGLVPFWQPSTLCLLLSLFSAIVFVLWRIFSLSSLRVSFSFFLLSSYFTFPPKSALASKSSHEHVWPSITCTHSVILSRQNLSKADVTRTILSPDFIVRLSST